LDNLSSQNHTGFRHFVNRFVDKVLPISYLPAGKRRFALSVGTGIAVAGWFIAFVWACSVSNDTAAGVVIFGIIVAGVRALFGGGR
jgi:hypothetical protein